ncbi:MAG: hypothetical protein ACTSVE_01795 [Candidatus Helarchaeota archaeon]
MESDIKKELEEIRKKVPQSLLVSIIRSLYFQTAWELPRELINVGINKELVWELQLKIAKETGVQGANSLRAFQFSGSKLERIVKTFMFAALNMGVKTSIFFKNSNECELIFKKNCGHGLKMKEYQLPFTCNEWCEVHFNAEIEALDSDFEIKLIEGLPQGKKYCRFKIKKID